jgi:putative glutamine amidotransferase
VNHVVDFDDDTTVIEGLNPPEEITVNSYHDFGILADDVPDELIVLGRATDGTVECVSHESRPIVGIMWHPERESPSGDFNQQILNVLFQTN